MTARPPEGRANGSSAPGHVSGTIWIQADQFAPIDAIRRYLTEPAQPGWPSLADAVVCAVGLMARAVENIEARK